MVARLQLVNLIRGGMEADEDVAGATSAADGKHLGEPHRPNPPRVICGLAAGGGGLNVAAHVLVAIARHWLHDFAPTDGRCAHDNLDSQDHVNQLQG